MPVGQTASKISTAFEIFLSDAPTYEKRTQILRVHGDRADIGPVQADEYQAPHSDLPEAHPGDVMCRARIFNESTCSSLVKTPDQDPITGVRKEPHLGSPPLDIRRAFLLVTHIVFCLA